MISIFFRFKANFNLKNYLAKFTPLHRACMRGNLELKTLECYVKNGADINVTNLHGRTPLMSMLGKRDDPAEVIETWKSAKLIPYLIDHSDLNVIDRDGDRILLVDPIQEEWQPVIVEAIAKLKMLNIPIRQSILDYISHKFDYWFDCWCTRELIRAKSLKLGNSTVSYFDLLVQDERKLIMFSKNKNLVKELKKNSLKHNFRIYGYKIRKNFFNAIEKRKIWDRQSGILSSCLPAVLYRNRPVFEKILDCLEEEDLLKK